MLGHNSHRQDSLPPLVAAWRARIDVVLNVDAGEIALAIGDPKEIGRAVRAARVAALAQAAAGGTASRP